MNKHFKVDLSNPNFDEIPVEVTMGTLRACSAMFTEQRELEDNKKEEFVDNTSAEDLYKKTYLDFIAVKARKLVNEALGFEINIRDIERFRNTYPCEEELIKELYERDITLPVISTSKNNQTRKSSPNFSMFVDPSKFKNRTNCSGMNVVECIIAFLKDNRSSPERKKKTFKKAFPSLICDLWRIEFETPSLVILPIVVGESFFLMYESYLRNRGISTNSILKRANYIKHILKWASMHGASVAEDLAKYKLETAPTPKNYPLSIEEICRIYYYDIDKEDISNKLKDTYKKVKDQFVLSCYLGQRYSDLSQIEESNFQGPARDVFTITQLKTNNEAEVSFNTIWGEYPKIAKEILERYKYKAPWKGSLATFNNRLHELCEKAGLTNTVEIKTIIDGQSEKISYRVCDLISSHNGRRTFITNAIKRGVHTQEIMVASGHKSEHAFQRYVNLKKGNHQ